MRRWWQLERYKWVRAAAVIPSRPWQKYAHIRLSSSSASTAELSSGLLAVECWRKRTACKSSGYHPRHYVYYRIFGRLLEYYSIRSTLYLAAECVHTSSNRSSAFPQKKFFWRMNPRQSAIRLLALLLTCSNSKTNFGCSLLSISPARHLRCCPAIARLISCAPLAWCCSSSTHLLRLKALRDVYLSAATYIFSSCFYCCVAAAILVPIVVFKSLVGILSRVTLLLSKQSTSVGGVIFSKRSDEVSVLCEISSSSIVSGLSGYDFIPYLL